MNRFSHFNSHSLNDLLGSGHQSSRISLPWYYKCFIGKYNEKSKNVVSGWHFSQVWEMNHEIYVINHTKPTVDGNLTNEYHLACVPYIGIWFVSFDFQCI